MGSLDTLSRADELDDLDSDELRALRQLAAAPSRHSAETVGLGPGAALTEHLTIERHLGAGAMGTVFLAHDRRLERHVAVKLHLGTSARELAQLEREARALAKVSHPNVLAVHEVGHVGPRLFIATEYVEGETVATWMQTERSWREIVEVFVAAGEGLVAAHEAGLVHRDFKPANVLIGRDGRVRVADFGLARPITDGPTQAHSGAETEAATTLAMTTRTPDERITGSEVQWTAAGTPAYMAPEQFRGYSSPIADQFSFCVALAEALTGARLYGERLAHVATPADFSLHRGQRRPPRRLVKLLRKGAALEPSARYPSMRVLVDELRRTLSPRRRWAFAGLVALGSLGLGAVFFAEAPRAEPCNDMDANFGEVWNDARATALAEAFAHAHAKVGADAWAPLRPRIDDYAADWARERQASCRATHVSGTQTERALEQSMACFERRRAELDAILRALVRIEGAAVSQAWRTLPDRSALAPCNDINQLTAWAEGSAPNTGHAADLAYARTLQLIGEPDLAREELASLTARAEADHDDHTRISATIEQALALHRAGKPEPAQALGESSYFAARRAGLEVVEQRAALMLAAVAILQQREPAAAKVWLRLSREFVGQPAEGVWLEALLLQEEGDPEGAIELLLTELDQLGAEDSVDLRLRLLDALNTAYDANGQPGAALATIDRALALTDELSGEFGSLVWPLLSNRGLVLNQLGRHDEAVASHHRAVDLAEALHGREFVDANGVSLNLALAYSTQGDPEAALDLLPGILAATRRQYGDRHPDLALVLEVRGDALRALGRVEDALADFHEALAIAREALGPAHPDVGRYLEQIARCLRTLGEREAEAEAVLAAIRAYEAAGLADHPRTRVARLEAAEVYLELDRPDEALDLAERAHAPSDPPEQLRGVWELARLQLEQPAFAARARALATELAAAASEAGYAELHAEIEATLAAN